MIFSVKFGSILHHTHSNVNADTGFRSCGAQFLFPSTCRLSRNVWYETKILLAVVGPLSCNSKCTALFEYIHHSAGYEMLCIHCGTEEQDTTLIVAFALQSQ